ncbi:MAG: hypothetical protein ACK45E_10100 [Ignavibacteria bacterium]
MNSFIAVLLMLLASSVMSASPYFRANQPHSLRCYQQDTTLSDYQLKLEEQYFAIDAILEEGVEIEHVADSIKPYVKGLTIEYRERIYKEHKRLVLPTTTASGSLGFFLFVPVVISFIQGDGIGIGLSLAGLGSLVGLSGTSYNNTNPSIRGALGLTGIGCLIATAIRAASVNDSNNRYNTALSYTLVIPKDFSYSVFPEYRRLPDGSVIPAVTCSLLLH